ncbi:hypothetical protein AB0R12_08965 [Streptomyces niveus]|uniref:effector-associated constant component EACC1 n=1 Tax=Streptomyces niveus TaxID=193462 RepID=UPI00342A2B35
MRLVVTVRGDENSGDGGAAELGTWLRDVPQLRGRVDRAERDGAPPGAMGAAVDTLVAVMEPGGVAAVFVGALVAWLQTRRSSHTISVTRPDGTRITLSSRQARALSPQEAADLAERLARPAGDGGQQTETQAETHDETHDETHEEHPRDGRSPDRRTA